tara:strand:- start:944 stop:1138 length:195 start_codon:yes stop_codon:yes gene_type:complete
MSEPTRSQILKAINELSESMSRREKNWLQLQHEEKVFGKPQEQEKEEQEDKINDWIKGQLGFGT